MYLLPHNIITIKYTSIIQVKCNFLVGLWPKLVDAPVWSHTLSMPKSRPVHGQLIFCSSQIRFNRDPDRAYRLLSKWRQFNMEIIPRLFMSICKIYCNCFFLFFSDFHSRIVSIHLWIIHDYPLRRGINARRRLITNRQMFLTLSSLVEGLK